MGIKLTGDQFKAVKGMVEMSQAFANQIYHIMLNHQLDKVNGCFLRIEVDPELTLTTRMVQFGEDGSDSGFIRTARGFFEDEYTPFGRNSAEYERLFARETIRSGNGKGKTAEKPLPPDGLWIGDYRNDPPVDSGEWDVNDSLS